MIIKLRFRSEIPLISNADFVSCSCGCRKLLGKMRVHNPKKKEPKNYYSDLPSVARVIIFNENFSCLDRKMDLCFTTSASTFPCF